MADWAVVVEGLRKCYGSLVAVDDLSFRVRTGELFGIVGPNGAGKTSTIECIEGLRRPSSGSVTVLGLQPFTERRALLGRIGVQLQEAALPDDIRVHEAMDLYGSFYPRPVPTDELLALVDLEDKASARFSGLSGGQRQRLMLGLALVGRPELVMLDELSSGLDPQARRRVWGLVQAIRDDGTTVILTTHLMEEAERLCDRVAIVDKGRLVALDTPDDLIAQFASHAHVSFRVRDEDLLTRLTPMLDRCRLKQSGNEYSVEGPRREIAPLFNALLQEEGGALSHLRFESATLDDAFIAATGTAIRD